MVCLATLSLLGSGTALGAVPGLPDDNPVVGSRWDLRLGGFLAALETQASVGFRGVLGSFVRLEDTLGLDSDKSLWWVDGFYRFAPRHVLDVGVLHIRRRGTATLDEPLDFLDIRFEGLTESRFDMDLLRFKYRYSFQNDGRLNAGFQVGINTFRTVLGLEGNGRVLSDGVPVAGSSFRVKEESYLFPVPSFGVFIDFAARRWLVFRFDGTLLDLAIKDIEGRFLDLSVTLDFFVSRHVGIGLGIGGTDLDYQKMGNTPLRITYRYSGVLGYLTLAF